MVGCKVSEKLQFATALQSLHEARDARDGDAQFESVKLRQKILPPSCTEK